MRQIVLDTETTGLEPSAGHRIIEIGCVVMENRRIQDKKRWYLNPEREIDEGAYAVHGISNDLLRGEPHFADIAASFVEFISDSELIIHNAPFDVGFLNAELALASREPITGYVSVTDTLLLARQLHPGMKNSLDALCKRYSVDHSMREQHGALIDAELLAQVYLMMTGGQTSFSLPSQLTAKATTQESSAIKEQKRGLQVISANLEELALHEKRLAEIDDISDKKCLWLGH